MICICEVCNNGFKHGRMFQLRSEIHKLQILFYIADKLINSASKSDSNLYDKKNKGCISI